ncbi:hypothetical protein NHX12_001783 [Muraenolepis orangiensis]|uniref:Uncharacterized protein n=1 Tax=Muraenolepis orangiensis TaxID=630683 RepID=A0A9Q0IFA4_9TELE|nr:hypothetical protein NHX12_001783 [Muraenolepis orangiensis]
MDDGITGEMDGQGVGHEVRLQQQRRVQASRVMQSLFHLKNYGENQDHYNEQLKKQETLRQVECCECNQGLEGCSTLRKYFGQLHYLQSRVPLAPGQEAECSSEAFYLRDHFNHNFSVDMSHQILKINLMLWDLCSLDWHLPENTRIVRLAIGAPVLFTDESKSTLSLCDRREGVWRRRGPRYAAHNINQHDRFGGGSVMVWGGISLEGRSNLHVLDNGILTDNGPEAFILVPNSRPYSGPFSSTRLSSSSRMT